MRWVTNQMRWMTHEKSEYQTESRRVQLLKARKSTTSGKIVKLRFSTAKPSVFALDAEYRVPAQKKCTMSQDRCLENGNKINRRRENHDRRASPSIYERYHPHRLLWRFSSALEKRAKWLFRVGMVHSCELGRVPEKGPEKRYRDIWSRGGVCDNKSAAPDHDTRLGDHLYADPENLRLFVQKNEDTRMLGRGISSHIQLLSNWFYESW
ncbi:hypothetical protein F5Y16DRAFT_399577 [Xylariaceae sp. FL0255]|nr:hypothetical protein F5Y16DRAFT_399577 [Xylariaceae sp. FL0255]